MPKKLKKFILSKNKRKFPLGTCALVIVSSFISFVILDFGLFKLIPQVCTVMQPDNLVHHSLIPNKKCHVDNPEYSFDYRINSLGFRDKEISNTKPEHTFRLLFLGDSFVQGAGNKAEDIFPNLVEAGLRSNGLNVETVNTGVGAYSPLLEYIFLKNRGINLQPDAVVLAVFMNDFTEDRMYKLKSHTDANGEITGVYVDLKQHIPAGIVRIVEGRSLSYYLFKKYEKQLWKTKGKVVAWLRHETPPDYTKSGVEFEIGHPDYDPYAITREIPDETFNDLFSLTSDYILRIKTYLDEKNIPLLLVIIPAGHQVDASQWDVGRVELKLTESSFPTKVIDELDGFAKANKFTYLDLTGTFKDYLKKHPDSDIYYPYDGHFTPLGNTIAAKEIKRVIESEQWIK